jgi:hypothetical protein
MHLDAHKLVPQPTDYGMTRRTYRLAWRLEAKLPHLECHGRRAELEQGTATESTADLRSRVRKTARDWPVRAGDKLGDGAR